MKPDFLKDAKFHYIKDTNKSYYGQIFSLYENEKKKQAIIFIDDKNCRCKSKV